MRSSILKIMVVILFATTSQFLFAAGITQYAVGGKYYNLEKNNFILDSKRNIYSTSIHLNGDDGQDIIFNLHGSINARNLVEDNFNVLWNEEKNILVTLSCSDIFIGEQSHKIIFNDSYAYNEQGTDFSISIDNRLTTGGQCKQLKVDVGYHLDNEYEKSYFDLNSIDLKLIVMEIY